MKTFILQLAIVAAGVAVTPSLWAGVEKFNSDEFNSIIVENVKAEKELNAQLETNTGIQDFSNQAHPNFQKELVGIVESESIVSPTTDHVVPRRRNANRLEEKNLKRVSQELDSSDSE